LIWHGLRQCLISILWLKISHKGASAPMIYYLLRKRPKRHFLVPGDKGSSYSLFSSWSV
jgi:hypothetical protein